MMHWEKMVKIKLRGRGKQRNTGEELEIIKGIFRDGLPLPFGPRIYLHIYKCPSTLPITKICSGHKFVSPPSPYL